MPESRDLGFVEALGKLRGLGLGVVGDWGGGFYVDDGVGGVVAAGEKTSEKASEAQGGYFKEVAFGA
jgi:hypothetical protein